ncbi:hypothetical protein LCGC14_1358200 [marine sediment metagenome]|uniref:Uncharacterized protein n=1 Tax=marine sediment metagenome TaxID=412755 RepID=A0A0F9NB65_9ZZZZ
MVFIGRLHCRRHARRRRAMLQDLWSRNMMKKMEKMLQMG